MTFQFSKNFYLQQKLEEKISLNIESYNIRCQVYNITQKKSTSVNKGYANEIMLQMKPCVLLFN